MRSTYLFLVVFMFCTIKTAISQETINGSIQHDGKDREYILYIPEAYNGEEAFPIVFCFHGFSQTNDAFMNQADFRPIADTANFIVCYPQGTLYLGFIPHWNVYNGSGSTADDIGFVETLIDDLTSTYNINQERIYATGFSNGAFLSTLLACTLSNKIAAIAPVSGTSNPDPISNCVPTHPIPTLEIHGTDDDLIAYEGNAPANGMDATLSVDEFINYWVDFNNCITEPEIIDLPVINSDDQSNVKHIKYTQGDRKVSVEHFKVIGGGHQWPGSSSNAGVGTLNLDIDASNEIWKFFSRYDLNGLVEPSSRKPKSFDTNPISYYPNPTNDIISFIVADADVKYELFTYNGILMETGIFLINKENNISLEDYPSGIYLLKVNDRSYKVVKR